MKRLHLYVNGKRYIVEECEGEAEIWPADRPKAEAARSCSVFVGKAHDARDIFAILKVEIAE